MIPDLFNVQRAEGAFEKTSGVGTVPDFVEFTGRVSEVNPRQKYDKTYTFTEFAAKIEIQRKLASDDQYRVMSRYPKNLATSASRSREKLGVQIFSLAFTYEPTDGDGTELCAADHPSNVTGVATQSNEGTSSLSAANVETTRINMHNFYDDIGEIISLNPDTIIIPRDLEETGWEIINSKGKVDTANNNANFHQGKYKLVVWDRLSDTNDLNKLDHLKRGELLETLIETISSQVGLGIIRKVQRLEAETRTVSNASTSALPRNRIKKYLDDIVCTIRRRIEVKDKKLYVNISGFMTDYQMQKEYLLWWNREPVQFFQDKDSNTLTAIYLGYYRVGTGWDDWRWVFGNLV